MTDERWLPIVGYEKFYEISDHGRVRSLTRTINYPSGRTEYRKARMMAIVVNKHNGYCYVGLVDDQKTQKSFRLHRLVAQHFIPNPNNEPEVNHEDFDKQNNAVSDLKWCDRFYQNQHAAKKPGRRWGLTNVRRVGAANFKSKPVLMTDLATNTTTLFESGNLAAAAIQGQQGRVSACCRGERSQYKGYKFQFAEVAI